ASGHLLASCRCAPGLLESSPPLDTPYSSRRGYVLLDDCRSTPDKSPSHSAPLLKTPMDIIQSVEMGVHSEVVGLAEACDNDFIMQVTLFVHGHPGMARGTSFYWWRHKVASQRSGQL
ncbi:hypothetical protein FQN60_004563, partial [Etheostoma spectabile]